MPAVNLSGAKVFAVGRIGCAALLLAVATMAYAPSLRGGFLWDDDQYVVENPLLRTPGGLARIWLEPRASPQYYPLVFTTFWVEQRLWGDRPLGYRAVNLLLHVANAGLLALVLRALGVRGAWWAAWIFALHPVHVETVAWITERKNLLSALFSLSALLAFLRYRGFGRSADAGVPGTAAAACRTGNGLRYGAAVGLFVGALLSKTVAATLPAVLLAILWWKQGRLARRDGLELLPFLLLGAVFGLFTAWLEKVHVGAQGAEWALAWGERVLLAARVPFFYLGKLLWPVDLSFVYPRWDLDAGSAGQYLYPLAWGVVFWILWRLRFRVGRGPLAGTLSFLATLAPVLGFLDVFPMLFSYVADHFQYPASAAPIALVAAGVGTAAIRFREGGAGAGAVRVAVAGGLLCALGLLTWGRAHVFESPEALWRDTLAKNPRAWLAHTNLGAALEAKGLREEAADRYREALRLKPDVPHAHNNLAALLAQEGRVREAEAQYRTAWGLNPNNYVASHELARLLAQQGRLGEAETFFGEAVRAKPDLVAARYDLALLLARTGRLGESIDHFRIVLTLDPSHTDTRFNLAVSLEEAGRLAEAAAEYRAVLALAPAHVNALNNLGSYLGSTGDLVGATALFARGVAVRPGDVRLRVNLGKALALQGRHAESMIHYREALRLDPEDASARRGLAEASAGALP